MQPSKIPFSCKIIGSSSVVSQIITASCKVLLRCWAVISSHSSYFQTNPFGLTGRQWLPIYLRCTRTLFFYDIFWCINLKESMENIDEIYLPKGFSPAWLASSLRHPTSNSRIIIRNANEWMCFLDILSQSQKFLKNENATNHEIWLDTKNACTQPSAEAMVSPMASAKAQLV